MSIRSIFLFICLISFSSCVELIDDLSLNADGSGTYKYTVNLSSSKVKINSILALDTLDGKPVPSLDEVRNKIDEMVSQLGQQQGISHVIFTANYESFMFKLSFDFESLSKLQEAIMVLVKNETNQQSLPELEDPWITFEDNTLTRSVPKIAIQKSRQTNRNDVNLLKNGSYTSITRFEHEVNNFSNLNGHLSKNNRAVMVRTDPFALTQDPTLLDNTIYLVK